MGRTVAELLQTISAEELQEWRAFDQISPIGDERSDLLTGVMTSTMVNIQPRKDKKIFKPIDFMPFATDRDRSKSVSEDIRAAFGKLKKA